MPLRALGACGDFAAARLLRSALVRAGRIERPAGVVAHAATGVGPWSVLLGPG
jgi:hypothetical protein